MSSLTRWDPMRDMLSLHDAMSQLFEQAVMRPGFETLGGTAHGAMNVIEVNGRYYCQVALPGIAPDNIELTVRQNTLTVKASLPEPLSEDLRKNATYLLREFGAGEYTRTVTLPKDVDAGAVEAHCANGILTIQVPVAQHAQPRRIRVQPGDPTSLPQHVVDEQKAVNEHQPVHAG